MPNTHPAVTRAAERNTEPDHRRYLSFFLPPHDLDKCPIHQERWLVGAVGIEPTTFGLKGRCSTTELRPYVLLTSYIEKI